MRAFRNIFLLLVFSALFPRLSFGNSTENKLTSAFHLRFSVKQPIASNSFLVIDDWEESEDDSDSSSDSFSDELAHQLVSSALFYNQLNPFSVEKKGVGHIPLYIIYCVYRL